MWDKEGDKGTLLSAAPPGRLGVSHMGNVLLCGGLLDFWGKFLWVWFCFYSKQCFLWISPFLFIISRAESFGTTTV